MALTVEAEQRLDFDADLVVGSANQFG